MSRDAFWRRKPLEALSHEEWESLCDGCGLCCLHKLEDADTGEIHHTRVACRLLDTSSARCRHYARRHRLVPDCLSLSPEGARSLEWLPPSCAYRLVAAGEDLPHWHPLVSGDAESVHRAGVSVRGWAVSEARAGDPEAHVIDLEALLRSRLRGRA